MAAAEPPTTVPRFALLIATNVLLDVVLERRPWVEDATALLDAVAKGRAVGYVASHAIPTVYDVVARERSRAVAATATSDLLQLLTVVPLDNAGFQRALGLGLRNFEDGAQAAACLQVGADYLITRNPKDHREAPVALRTAGEALALVRSAERARLGSDFALRCSEVLEQHVAPRLERVQHLGEIAAVLGAWSEQRALGDL